MLANLVPVRSLIAWASKSRIILINFCDVVSAIVDTTASTMLKNWTHQAFAVLMSLRSRLCTLMRLFRCDLDKSSDFAVSEMFHLFFSR